MLRSNGGVYAAFRSTCLNCKSVIDRGNKIAFDDRFGKFVYADCARAMAVPSAPTAPVQGDALTALPAGVRPHTLVTYRTEWARYEALVKHRGFTAVPGRDCPWDVQLLWAYMSFRGETCKPQTVTAGLSALTYFGARFGFLLPTSKNDSKSLLYRQFGNVEAAGSNRSQCEPRRRLVRDKQVYTFGLQVSGPDFVRVSDSRPGVIFAAFAYE